MLIFAQETNVDVVHTGESKASPYDLQDPDTNISLEQKGKYILLGGQKQDIRAELKAY